MARRAETSKAVYAAIGSAVAMIAHQVGAKAVRDALFLSNFAIVQLPVMVMAASLFSIMVVLLTSRAMIRFTPARLVPAAFAVSGFFYFAMWGMIGPAPRLTAVLIYLEVLGFGSVLTSGFWSLISERFDPRAAKKYVGRIAAGGTLGGIFGGLLAERVAGAWSISTMLPILAGFQLLCAITIRELKPLNPDRARKDGETHAEGETRASVFSILKDAPYLRTLAVLVLLGTVSAAIIDYVFKAQAVAAYGKGAVLLRFFALFYAGIGVLTFLLQTVVSRIALEKLGLAKTTGSLPFAVAIGGVGALVVPGLPSAGIARALEAVFRGSLFRSGYELFYTPIPPLEKRAAKSIVDVGFDRLGDGLGSAIVRLMLMLGPAVAIHAILTMAVLIGLLGLWMAGRLHKAYIGILERSLLHHGEGLDLADFGASIVSSRIRSGLSPMNPSTGLLSAFAKKSPAAASRRPIAADSKRQEEPDPVARRLADLLSGNVVRVLRALADDQALPPLLIPQVIALFAWDQVSSQAIRALRRVATVHTGQLLDALLDPGQDFSVRRRIPRVLSVCPSQRAVNGLLLGLQDKRFEVRFQCGRALATVLANNATLRVSPEAVFAAVLDEVKVSRPVWESHQLLDHVEDREGPSFLDDFLRDRTNSSLEHVFTLLSLALPKEPLKIAFHGLHTDDEELRGTALEYLESILPPHIRERLWPFLDVPSVAPRTERSRQEVLAALMQSNQSILLNLAELKKKSKPNRSSG